MNAAIFFDRDGTLIHDPGYLNHPDQVQVLDGAAEALREFHLLGYKTVVATNQSGVARGLITLETLAQIHDRVRELLAAKGATLDAIYACPYHPEGTVPEYRQDSDWRKPRPGMLLAAAREMDLDLTQSWMIGDSDRDVEAGRSAGCRTILVGAKPSSSAPTDRSRADFVAVNLREAVNIVKRYRRAALQDRRSGATGETGREQSLAAKSAEILSMLSEATSAVAEEVSAAAAVPEPATPEATPQVALAASPPEPERTLPPGVPSGPTPRARPGETDQILRNILEQLRRMQKNEMFREFSLLRLLAGVVQMFVPFCLLLAGWLLMGPRRQDNSVLIVLGFAAVLQLMALTFYIMNGRK